MHLFICSSVKQSSKSTRSMTLPSRRRIRDLSPGGLGPIVFRPTLGTEASRNTESLRVSGEEIYVSLIPKCQSGGRTRDFRLSKQAVLAC